MYYVYILYRYIHRFWALRLNLKDRAPLTKLSLNWTSGWTWKLSLEMEMELLSVYIRTRTQSKCFVFL